MAYNKNSMIDFSNFLLNFTNLSKNSNHDIMLLSKLEFKKKLTLLDKNYNALLKELSRCEDLDELKIINFNNQDFIDKFFATVPKNLAYKKEILIKNKINKYNQAIFQSYIKFC
jgi:hypothetical protein